MQNGKLFGHFLGAFALSVVLLGGASTALADSSNYQLHLIESKNAESGSLNQALQKDLESLYGRKLTGPAAQVVAFHYNLARPSTLPNQIPELITNYPGFKWMSDRVSFKADGHRYSCYATFNFANGPTLYLDKCRTSDPAYYRREKGREIAVSLSELGLF